MPTNSKEERGHEMGHKLLGRLGDVSSASTLQRKEAKPSWQDHGTLFLGMKKGKRDSNGQMQMVSIMVRSRAEAGHDSNACVADELAASLWSGSTSVM